MNKIFPGRDVRLTGAVKEIVITVLRFKLVIDEPVTITSFTFNKERFKVDGLTGGSSGEVCLLHAGFIIIIKHNKRYLFILQFTLKLYNKQRPPKWQPLQIKFLKFNYLPANSN